jgi:serine/threonine protein kinase
MNVTRAASFVEVVRKSRVVKEADLQRFLSSAAAQGVDDAPEELARAMHEAGLLTAFQVGNLLRGRTGLVLGKYIVLEPIGSGGMSAVFLARHQETDERVAIKMLPAEMANDPSAVARFQREAKAVAALNHRNIVRAIDVDQHAGRTFFVLEYVEGETLQSLVEREGGLPVERALDYVMQAAAGLQHIHEGALVHRDIKPGNLLLDRTGTVKVLDLGLARFVDQRQDELTKKMGDSGMLGTADYIAPEQALSTHDADIRSDIYSLGGTLYFLLSGQVPFGGMSVTQKLLAAQLRAPRPVTELRPDLPPALGAVVARMMHKDPGQRYQTPAEVLTALARVGGASAPERLEQREGAAKAAQEGRVWLVVALAAAAVVALVGVGAWWAL